MTPETCPNCGAEVPEGARACPECGADERTGWSESAAADRLGIPSTENFDYEHYIREEFGPPPQRSTAALWAVIASLLLLALLLLWLF